jgi:hypothetical protein
MASQLRRRRSSSKSNSSKWGKSIKTRTPSLPLWLNPTYFKRISTASSTTWTTYSSSRSSSRSTLLLIASSRTSSTRLISWNWTHLSSAKLVERWPSQTLSLVWLYRRRKHSKTGHSRRLTKTLTAARTDNTDKRHLRRITLFLSDSPQTWCTL